MHLNQSRPPKVLRTVKPTAPQFPRKRLHETRENNNQTLSIKICYLTGQYFPQDGSAASTSSAETSYTGLFYGRVCCATSIPTLSSEYSTRRPYPSRDGFSTPNPQSCPLAWTACPSHRVRCLIETSSRRFGARSRGRLKLEVGIERHLPGLGEVTSRITKVELLTFQVR